MINTIFNIVNFILVIIACAFIIKHFLPKLQASFDQEKLYLDELRDEKQDLLFLQKDVERAAHEQDKLGKELIKKIDQWYDQVAQETLLKQNEYSYYNSMIEKKLEVQFENYKLSKIKEEAQPYILQKLERELKEYFKEQKNVDKYFISVFNDLK